MAWVTPKTNWVGTDVFYAADWKRIVGNVKYLADEAGIPYTPYDTVSDGDALTPTNRNDVVDMIGQIYTAANPDWDMPVLPVCVDFGSAWNSKVLNNIEQTLEALKEELEP